ncbi:hypothetical protein ABFX02_13G064600 [Erythranthe guttata]
MQHQEPELSFNLIFVFCFRDNPIENRFEICPFEHSLCENMGCAGSSQTKSEGAGKKKIRKPRAWKHPQPITRSQLIQLREEFWDTAPHYGGRQEIWDALRAAAEADPTLAQAIVENAGIVVHNADMTVCFDETGARYELPKYVLSEPKNLIPYT